MRLRTPRRGRSWVAGVVTVCLLGATAAPVGAARSGAGAARPVSYVSLGDSYTAGPGIPSQIPEAAGCGRSDHNYPHLVARALQIENFPDVSCGRATTEHMTGPQQLPDGSLIDPQLDALTAAVDLVTLGVGGNDIGFGEIIATCVRSSLVLPVTAPCRDHYHRHGDELGDRIAATAPKVAAVLAAIRERAPAARVLVVGYPVILPAAGPGCWPVIPIAVGDVAWLRTVAGRLNAMLAGEAARAGATFVDTYSGSVGHDVCQLPGRKWVEGFVPTSPASAVHPNALGMAHTAAQVLRAIDPS